MSATQGLAHSIHVRLVARAKELGIEAQLLLERYALHRLLYRLSKSSHADRFVLKGAQMMLVWIGETVRPTRDADLLGLDELSDVMLAGIFEGLCDVPVEEPDGMEYSAESIRVTRIRRGEANGGRRVTLGARLGNARLSLQVDIGVGDVITPEPSWVQLPSLLDLPSARLLGYPPETTIAEKLETIVSLGVLNSRLRDYFDILVLSKRKPFDGSILKKAVQRTFQRRGTAIPEGLPSGLRAEFAGEPGKQAQWAGLRSRLGESKVPEELAVVVDEIASFVGPVLRTLVNEDPFARTWSPGGPWKPTNE